jgi:hypothetical protein
MNGIEISKQRIYQKDTVDLIYNGLLVKEGADKIFAHIGYGENWEAREELEMDRTQEGYKLRFDAKMSGTLYICFKDSANNWDNNSGQNYSFKVQPAKRMERTAKLGSRG